MKQENEQIGAVRVLVNGVRLAQSRGAFSLEEASLVHKAVEALTTPPEERAAKYSEAVMAPPVDNGGGEPQLEVAAD